MPQEPRQDFSVPDDSHDEWEERTPLELEDDRWDAFLPDDAPDPLPEPGDFWIEFHRQHNCPESCLAIPAIC